ncbi:MAG: hypothetical protein ACO3CD_06490 [Candidatus Nanopelagicaceae bacterium]
MSATFVTNTYTSSTNVSIPNNAYGLTLDVRGARGGQGGSYASVSGLYGEGRRGQFAFKTHYVARTLALKVGGIGSNGSSPGGGNGGGGGLASGGTGGSGSYTTSYRCDYGSVCGPCSQVCCGYGCSNSAPCSGGYQPGNGCAEGGLRWFCPQTCYSTVNTGGGGGGGGATGISGLVVAGGGGGGSGGATGGNGGNGTDWNTSLGSNTSGSNGSNRGSGGGTGGGGGGVGSTAAAQSGGRSAYDSNELTLTSSGTWSSDPSIIVSYYTLVPEITVFSASPNPQNSSTGIPQYSSVVSYSVSNCDYITISGPGVDQTITNTSGGLSVLSGTFNAVLDQSVAGTSSPVSSTYTLTAYAGSQTDTAVVTVEGRNDNIPSNSWTQTFMNLNPKTIETLDLGTLAGVDMPTTISVAGSGNFIGTAGSFSSSKEFTNGQVVQLRTTTLDFNTDITGQTGIYGKTNTKTVTVTTPSGSFNVNVITRPPVIQEIFDYANNVNKYPYEDIDLISNNPTEYLSSAQIDVNDIEIDMEIKSDNPDVEISINGGAWQSTRSL